MPLEYIWPMNRTHLEDYYEIILRCNKCGLCRNIFPSQMINEKFTYQCPPGERWKFEAFYASGRIEIARALLERQLTWSPRLLQILYTCTTCGACEEWCEATVRCYPLKIIEEMRIRCVKEGKGPLRSHKKLAESIQKNHNPYGEPHGTRSSWASKNVKSSARAELAYFVGCTSSYRRKEIAESSVKVLEKLGVKFQILHSGEWCCGGPLFRTGQIELAKKTMEHNLEALKKAKVEKLIFSCPGCYKAFKESPKYGLRDPSFEVFHITEFLLPLLREQKAEFVEQPKRITYHDPCYLGRHLMIYEQPREILKLIPGLELTEMYRNRKNAWCCGAGGGVIAQYGHFAQWTATKRIEEAQEVGAQTLVSACPLCKHNFKTAFNKKNTEIRDIVEIVAEALSM